MSGKPKADVQPWYREPWPWLLMLGPLIVIVAGVITAYLAVVSNDGLVEDDYYKQGLTVNQRTERDRRAGELGMAVEFVLSGDGQRIRALLRAREGVALPDALALRITHPTRSGLDQSVMLQAEGAGLYTGALSPLPDGRWHISVEDDKSQWRLLGDWVRHGQSGLQWTASARVTSEVDWRTNGR